LVRAGKYDPAVVDHLSALYDGEIRAMDVAMGDLLDFLSATGLDRKTCVLFTSDHGEEFAEHGDLMHSRAKLYEELIRVPLIVWCPARFRGGRVVSGIVSHPDILPTALEIVGSAAPPNLDGASLLPALQAGAEPTRDVAISEVDGSIERKQGTVRALRTDQHKLIESSIDASEMLFDLPADPTEVRNLRQERPDLAQELRAAGRRRAAPAVAAAPVVTPDAGVLERLRALGYID
jgi:arylsulfatase A-like enzyme